MLRSLQQATSNTSNMRWRWGWACRRRPVRAASAAGAQRSWAEAVPVWDGRAPVLSPTVCAHSVSSWLVFSSLSSVLSFGTLWAGPGGATQAGASQSVAGAPAGQCSLFGRWRTDARDSHYSLLCTLYGTECIYRYHIVVHSFQILVDQYLLVFVGVLVFSNKLRSLIDQFARGAPGERVGKCME